MSLPQSLLPLLLALCLALVACREESASGRNRAAAEKAGVTATDFFPEAKTKTTALVEAVVASAPAEASLLFPTAAEMDDLQGLIDEAAARRNSQITESEVARQLGLEWPLRRTDDNARSARQIQATIEKMLEERLDQELPFPDDAELDAAFEVDLPLWKVGDRVEYNPTGLPSTANFWGVYRSYDANYLRIGDRRIAMVDVPDSVRMHFIPEVRERYRKRYKQERRIPLYNQRRELAKTLQAQVREEVLRGGGMYNLDGTWLTSDQCERYVRAMTLRKRQEQTPRFVQETMAANDHVDFHGRWLPATRAETIARERARLAQAWQRERDARVAEEADLLDRLPNRPADKEPPFPISPVAASLVFIETQVAGGRSASSGFLVQMEGRQFVVTNQHCIAGATSLSLKTMDQVQLRPEFYEFSPTCDLVRIEVKLPPDSRALCLSVSTQTPEPGAAVWVLGNSGGEGAATVLHGDVRGIGPDKIEVSAEFIGGNSGSPVLSRAGRVIGVATYATREAPDWVTDNTRFADVRRFAYRLTEDSAFVPMGIDTYMAQAYILADVTTYMNDIARMAVLDAVFMANFFSDLPRQYDRYHDARWCDRVRGYLAAPAIRPAAAASADVRVRVVAWQAVCALAVDESSYIRNQLKNTTWRTGFLAAEGENLQAMCAFLADFARNAEQAIKEVRTVEGF